MTDEGSLASGKHLSGERLLMSGNESPIGPTCRKRLVREFGALRPDRDRLAPHHARVALRHRHLPLHRHRGQHRALGAGPGGDGVCWDYFRVLRRLGVIEVREGDLAGPAVLRATRAEGPGAIGSTPNVFSPPPPTPTPGAPAPATPASATWITADLASPAAMTLGDPGR